MIQVEPSRNKKIKVIVAAKQFLYRLGIKTIINVIGAETELFETNSYENMLSKIVENDDVQFLIINKEIIPEPVEHQLSKIRKNRPSMSVMILDDDIMDGCFYCKLMGLRDKDVGNCPCPDFEIKMDSQEEIVRRFQEFLFDSMKNRSYDFENLSEREIEVLKSVAHGFSNKEIADKLHISTNTVITHRKNITVKLGIKTIAGLTVFAITNNIIRPDEVNTNK